MLFVFILYIFSLFRIGDGDLCFVMQFVADVVAVDDPDMVDDFLPSRLYLLLCPFLPIINCFLPKCTA